MDKTTIAINCEAAPSGFALINEDDYDPDKDSLFEIEQRKETKISKKRQHGLATDITDKDSDSAAL